VSRQNDLVRFYELMDHLKSCCGGTRLLRDCHRQMDWPNRGVYFFFEPGEGRSDSGSGLRVVRVGTHAVSKGAKSTLWGRLGQHRGQPDGTGGHHRGSVFRLLVGAALAQREPGLGCPNWGGGKSAPKTVREEERDLEIVVSQYIGAMPFLWLACDDEPSSQSMRSYIERNSIALLTNAAAPEVLDRPSATWLGGFSPSEKVRQSGL
jgi:hypothetical protein